MVDQFKRNIILFGQLLLAINMHPASIDFSSWATGFTVAQPIFLYRDTSNFTKKKLQSYCQEYWFVFFWYALLSAIPILFSNNVHIGRLFLSLPFDVSHHWNWRNTNFSAHWKIGQKRTTHLQKNHCIFRADSDIHSYQGCYFQESAPTTWQLQPLIIDH